MLERLFGRKKGVSQSTPKEEYQPAKFEGYNLEPGHAYILLGGDPDRLRAECGGCGAPYKGPCQPACEYCSTHRLSYYVDVTDIRGLNSIPEESKNEDISFILPEGGLAKFEDYAKMDRVISSEVQAGFEFKGGIVITKKFKGEDYTEIGTLIIADGGSAVLGFETKIGKFIVGRGVTFVTDDYTSIQEFMTASNDTKYKMGFETKIGSHKSISPEEFVNQVVKASQN